MEGGPSVREMTVAELAERLGGRLCGPGRQTVHGVNTLRDASPEEVSFLTEEKQRPLLADCRAAAVLVPQETENCRLTQIVVGNVQKALIEALKLFAPPLTSWKGVHPTAVVEPDAVLEEGVGIGPNTYIGHQVRIGAYTVIGPNCSIGERTQIGSRCRLDSNVVVYHDCRIGNFCILQSHCTIGATGFGYAFVDGRHQLIPHNGGVILEDGVEIGANSCVDRAKFGQTVVGAGTKIDNLVQVGHNVRIGRMCLLAGQVGLAGSAVLGDGVVLGGQVGVADHITVGSGAMAGAAATIVENVEPGGQVWGTPAQEIAAEKRSAVWYRRLPKLAEEVRELKKRIQQLENAKNNPA
ncbi:MAG TPA: UDP-3-O-(3-hydroxymyristoyl)glucosamine N-acyltransferase [Anaerohalosphaeraceae bacterium]|nr:UDP-3-O-(3-hydroxymyristoyl)glucosamine N-acyltransferase [Anaerohalosphaeraceae bacterium]